MTTWQTVCEVTDLQADAGVCALVEGVQVAIFYLPAEAAVFALGNYDPLADANVLARGIIGDIGGELVVASPLYKQHFSLSTGACLEADGVAVPVYPVRIAGAGVQVCV